MEIHVKCMKLHVFSLFLWFHKCMACLRVWCVCGTCSLPVAMPWKFNATETMEKKSTNSFVVFGSEELIKLFYFNFIVSMIVFVHWIGKIYSKYGEMCIAQIKQKTLHTYVCGMARCLLFLCRIQILWSQNNIIFNSFIGCINIVCDANDESANKQFLF